MSHIGVIFERVICCIKIDETGYFFMKSIKIGVQGNVIYLWKKKIDKE